MGGDMDIIQLNDIFDALSALFTNQLGWIFIIGTIGLVLWDFLVTPPRKIRRGSRKSRSLWVDFLILLILLAFVSYSSFQRVFSWDGRNPATGTDLLFVGLNAALWVGGGIYIVYQWRARKARLSLQQDIASLKSLTVHEFEEFVANLFRKRGYQARVVGDVGDHGIDIEVINLQGEKELVQCKRWTKKWLGERIVRDFYGALMHDEEAVRGYIVTTSYFSKAARKWAQGKPISLIDGPDLSEAVQLIRKAQA